MGKMRKPSGHKEIWKIVKKALKINGVKLMKGKKHHFIRNGNGKVPIPSTPSDRHSPANFNRDLEKFLNISI